MRILLILLIVFISNILFAQGTANDIPVKELPKDVKDVLEQYVEILTSSKDLDECASNFIEVAGGGLVNEDGESLRSTIKDFSLKKDYNDIKFYSNPPNITRVNLSTSNGQGYGASTIKGKVYKIWIGKKDSNNGMPAPVSIMVPEGHETIKSPKVVNIGSF